jgi:hypothetical protein
MASCDGKKLLGVALEYSLKLFQQALAEAPQPDFKNKGYNRVSPQRNPCCIRDF